MANKVQPFVKQLGTPASKKQTVVKCACGYMCVHFVLTLQQWSPGTEGGDKSGFRYTDNTVQHDEFIVGL